MAEVNRSQREMALLNQAMEGDGTQRRQGGIISGPIMDAISRPKRERQANQALDIEQGRGQDILGASPIDQGKVDPGQLESLQGLLQDPNTRAEGVSALNEIETRQGLNQSAESLARVGQAQTEFELRKNVAVANEERQMRTAWQTAIKPTVNVLRSVDLGRNQLQLGSPEAALNSARIFIQQVDSSMVTNPEIASVIAQQGLAGQWAQIINWAVGGGNFDDPTRKRMVDSMVAIGEVYKQYGDVLMQQTQELAGNNVLPIDPNNVTTMAGYANQDFDLSFPGNKSTGQEGGAGTSAPAKVAPAAAEHPAGSIEFTDDNGRVRILGPVTNRGD